MANITMDEIDTMINAAIARLSSGGFLVSFFSVDLYSLQRRITEKLIRQCIEDCNSRGLAAYRQGNYLKITVDLEKCFFNPEQAEYFQLSLVHARNEGFI